MEKRCPGCMRMKEQSPLCEHCGCNDAIDNLPHQLPVGTMLHNQYQVGKALGQGGFGITYIGWDTALDNPVAIKEYYPGSVVNRFSSQSRSVTIQGTHVRDFFYRNRERFLQEARVLARLRDIEGIVCVQNLFEENNTAYIVMEYLQGMDLRKYMRLQGGCLTVAQTLAVLRPVMNALQKVHEEELIHRDISPDNIMVQTDGSAKLLDFGAAREFTGEDAGQEIARSTETILKYGFAPIEQYQKRGNMGPWTDVYALCATIYYCLTGKIPPEAPERMNEDLPVGWEAVPGLTAGQIDALERGMALKVKDRISSVAELRDALYSNQPSGSANDKKKHGLYGKKKKKTSKRRDTARQLPDTSTRDSTAQPEQLPDRQGKIIPEETKEAPVPQHTEHPAPDIREPVTGSRADDVKGKKAAVQQASQSSPGNETGGRGKKLLPVLLVFAALITAVCFLFPGKTIEAAPAPEPPSWQNNVLMADDFLSEASRFDEAYLSTSGMDFAGACSSVPVFGSQIPRGQIAAVTVLDTLSDMPEDAWDVSAGHDGSVMAWAVPDGSGLYELYIGAEGGVNAREATPFLFCFYSGAREMALSNLHTDEATDMTCMFTECSVLAQLDLTGWNTAAVTGMAGMFRACSALNDPDLSCFDVANVTDYENFMSDGKTVNGLPWQELFYDHE